jgi:hypothetical protein
MHTILYMEYYKWYQELSLTKNCGLIFFQGRDVFWHLKATEICHYAHKPTVGE